MIESLAVYLLVGSLCFGLGYACGTHATWLPALGSKVKSGVGGLFSRKVVAPAPSPSAASSVNALFDAFAPSSLPPGEASLVGEQGPELLVPGAHWVTINVPGGSGGGGGGGSSTVTGSTGGGTAPPPLWFMQPPGDSK